jgi:hypothetical protein
VTIKGFMKKVNLKGRKITKGKRQEERLKLSEK